MEGRATHPVRDAFAVVVCYTAPAAGVWLAVNLGGAVMMAAGAMALIAALLPLALRRCEDAGVLRLRGHAERWWRRPRRGPAALALRSRRWKQVRRAPSTR